MNYDEEIIENTFSTSTVTTDLTNILNQGYTCVRIASFWTSTSSQGTFTRMGYTAAIAHTLGIDTRCMIQGPNGGSSLTSNVGDPNNIIYWEGVIVSETESGESLCDRTDVANEEITKHDGTLTDSQVITAITQTIPSQIKSDGIYTHPLSYAAENFPQEIGALESLESGGTVGDLDQICINLYSNTTEGFLKGVLNGFYSYFPLGCITEWNIIGNPGNLSQYTDAQLDQYFALAMQIFRDFSSANHTGQFYYFTYSNPLGDVNAVDAFAAYLHTGVFRSFWNGVFLNYGNGTY